MPERKRRFKILLLHAVLLPTLLYVYSFFTLAPRPWTGVDKAVVEKIAKEQGRVVKSPLINTDQGDLLLFVFLVGGAIGGFAAGYFWRQLISEKKSEPK
jgi:ABC-type cobalt transport system substrate-binding protein